MNSILKKAEELINGDRQKAYGSVTTGMKKTAMIWSAIMGIEFTPEQVILCMMGLKLSRQSYKHSEDNLIDIAGYAGLLEKMVEELDKN